MSIFREGISFRMNKADTAKFRFANQTGVDISSVEVVKDPTDVTVTDSISGQNVFLTVTDVKAGRSYEIGPKITFTNSEIQYFPITINGWE